jgi:heme-degrading monooxygenase HmoA
MMTVVTEIEIKAGQEPHWDAAFRDRLQDAPNQPGWVAMQLVIPLDAPNKRVVIGTWESRADWEAWHDTEMFKATRDRLDGVEQKSSDEAWYEVVDIRSIARQ